MKLHRWLLTCGCMAIMVVSSSCSTARHARARGPMPDRTHIRDTAPILRNTIGAQTTARGMDPILVSGYGVVVDLHGTGSGDVPGPVRAILEREMLQMGVGREAAGPLSQVTPTEMLNDRNTAVVLVSAVLPPGSPKGTRFDVSVQPLVGTATTNLEGGRLYTTRLFRGLIRPSAPATQPIAEARGELFLNPFAKPGDPESGANTLSARVLDGGEVVEPTLVTLELDSPSHTRSRAITEAINARFTRERGHAPVAIGRNEETIEINIPQAWHDKPNDFMQLLRHTRVDQSFPNEAAVRYVRALRSTPGLATDLSWCLQALGEVSIAHLRDLYTSPEEAPRQAAILTGAKLGDMAVRTYLEDIITHGSTSIRPRAIALLGELGADPKINLFLRDLLNDEDFDVRLAAYEALAERADPWIHSKRIDRKFRVDTVPSTQPTVYVTMQGDPKVVLLGSELTIRRPVFVSAWDGKLMLRAEEQDREIGVYYEDPRTSRASTGRTRPGLDDLITYLGHKPTPEEPAPGLDMTYSQIVGAVSQIIDRGGASALFVSETDRLGLELLRSRQLELSNDRPELSTNTGEKSQVATGAGESADAASGDSTPPISTQAPAEAPKPAKRNYVVPLTPAKKSKKDGTGVDR